MMEQVNGKTKLYGLIGNPISHTLSPAIHNRIAHILGDNLIYLPFHVLEENIPNVMKSIETLGISGFNVTVPHKKSIMPFLTELDDLAKQIDAVNTVKKVGNKFIGFNTDYYGLINLFENHNIGLEGKTVVILGAGGAAYSAAVAVASQNAKKLIIVNRTLKNANNLAQHIKKYYNTSVDVLEMENLCEITFCDCVIQTTSVGIGDTKNTSPIPVHLKSFFKRTTVAIDIIYNPWETVFLKDAREMGCQVVNGFEMLVYQAVAAYKIWNDKSIDKQVIEDVKLFVKQYV